ncbi:EmrB/QacA subfamily drug resistance transporter [Catenulispora sp. MAP5-51]|uniref:MDR family MFS transporter n=1 Tax=Catenulispora sp. MAP5-51 TaxID=3156298 RepID=UPI0035127989
MTDPAPAAAEETGIFTHRQILTILSGLLMAIFLASLDQTIVSVAMRTVADDLRGFSLQAWATTAFLITSTITTPLYGKLSDMYGRRPFMLFAIGVFITGSVLCGLAQSMYQLAAFRAVQGLGAGGLFALSLAIIGDIVPPRERAKYQGYSLAMFATSSVLGPVLGGFFAGAHHILGVSGWRWIFYVNVPIAAAAFILVAKNLHLPAHHTRRRIDWPGAAALAAGMVPLLIVATNGRTWGWGSGSALACYVIGGLGLAAFLYSEKRYGDDALIPLRLFGTRTYSIATTSTFVLGMAMYGGLLVVPLYLQIVKGGSPTKAGLEMLPLVAGLMVSSVVCGQAIMRTGRYRIFPVTGTALILAALLLFATIGADTPVWQTMLVMLLMGLGVGGSMQPLIVAVQNSARPAEIGVATSSMTFFQSMGGTLGAAVFLSILFSTLGDHINSALSTASQSPGFAAAAATHQQQLAGGAVRVLNDTAFVGTLPPVLAHPYKTGFSGAMSVVFLSVAAIMAVSMIVICFLPELPLRTMSGAQARVEADAAGADTSDSAAEDSNLSPATPPRTAPSS